MAEVGPDVLTYPSPTTSRYLVFAAALVSAGLFVGAWVHNQTVGQEWAQTYLDCRAANGAAAPSFTDPSYLAQEEVRACVADVEWTRALITAGGALATVVLAILLLLAAPAYIQRRRGLRELDVRLDGVSERVRTLAEEAGVRGRVRPMLGRTTQRDAFSFGRPGRYVVALPPAAAVRWRDATLFDPLVSHELAHVRHGDVSLAWLTRSVGLALAPLLVLPVVVGLVSGEPSLLPGYTWRAVLLALVVLLVSASLLRSREHDADLRAAALRGGPASMARLLDLTAAPTTSRSWRRLLANHPDREDRRRVLDDPTLITRTGFVDGFTAAFLVALALPLLVASVSPAAGQLGDSNAAYVVAALVLGPLLAGSVGLAAWRRAYFAADGPVWLLAAGVGVGIVLGKSASLQQTAAGLTGLRHPVWLLVIGLAAAGATLLSSALGHLWADASRRFRGARPSWVVGLVVNAVLFTAVLWASELFVFSADNGGWVFARAGLVYNLANWPVAAGALVLAGAALAGLLLSAGRAHARNLVAAGLVVGLVAAAGVVVFRLVEGAPGSDDETIARVLTTEWLAGLVGAASVLVLAVLRPRWGAVGGLVVGVVACPVVVAAFIGVNVVGDGRFHLDQVTSFLEPALGLTLLLGVAALPLAGLTTRLSLPRVPALAVLGVTAVAVLAVTAATLPSRAVLVDAHPVTKPLDGARPARPATDVESAEEAALREVRLYVDDVAAGIEREDRRIEGELSDLLGDEQATITARRQRLAVEVLGPLQDLLADAESFDATAADLDSVHAEAVAALRAAVERVGVIDEVLRTSDQASFDRAVALRDEEGRHWDRWYGGIERLVAELTS